LKLGIIGFGFVGNAVGWAHRSDELVIRDPKLKDSASLDKFTDCDGIFVCVPSPSTNDGHCDASILEQVIKELLFVVINKQIPIICKTTAPPSVYERLQKEYPNVVYCPEFLTQANANADYQNAEYFVIGGDYDWAVKAREIIRHGVPMVHEKFIIVSIKTASLYKYMMNSYLATKVTFMNDFKKIADVEEVDWQDLVNLSHEDDRIGYTHMAVPGPDGQYGYGGACFPKDTSALAFYSKLINERFTVLEEVIDVNNKIRNK